MTNLLRFFELERQTPNKRRWRQRVRDYGEIYQPFSTSAASQQASRCSQCGIPFCQVHCPLGNNIPDWLKLSAEGRLYEAYQQASATNNMPEICGRICPQDRLCEGHCVVKPNFGALTIGAIERFIGDTAWDKGWIKSFKPPVEQHQSVGIIGAGPAGMAAAEQLRLAGYQVDVYDRYDRIGGLLVYGIPEFKLEKRLVQRRAQRLIDSGIRFHLNFEIGRDAHMQQLRDKHDAVLIATGVYRARQLDLDYGQANNVIAALDYLSASNRICLGEQVAEVSSGILDVGNQRVVVVGGGDTAMDCVRTAIRQGAKSVTCLYRRDRASMPGSAQEVVHAEEEGVAFKWLAAPTGFVLEDGVSAIKAQQMKPTPAREGGRPDLVPIPGSDFLIPVDKVILALGYEADDYRAMLGSAELAVTDQGTVVTAAPSLATNLPGVFAAGDCARGASLVVWAIRDGRDVAAQIIRYLQQQSMEQSVAQVSPA